jgi:hypothetical protein
MNPKSKEVFMNTSWLPGSRAGRRVRRKKERFYFSGDSGKGS